MKQIVIVCCALSIAAPALSQGHIIFNNRRPGSVVAPIYGVNPAAPDTQLQGQATTNGGSVNYTNIPLLTGTGFSAALFGGSTVGDAATSLSALETVSFLDAPVAGFVAAPATPTPVSGVTGTGSAPWAFQVRAWDNMGGTVTTWAGVLANPTVARGESMPFVTTVSIAPTAAGYLVGLQSFNLVVVPEPSLIALGALGLGALLLRRRKA